MSEIIQQTPPQAGRFAPEAVAAPEAAPAAPEATKAAKQPISAAKAAKAAPEAKAAPKAKGLQYLPKSLGERLAKVTKSGTKAECQVLIKSSGLQCSNPWNHTLSNGKGTCSTHAKRIAANGLAGFRFASKVQPYDLSLWGTKAIPEAPEA